MKTITFLVLFLAMAASSLHADYLSPFADSKVGATATFRAREAAKLSQSADKDSH